MKNRRLFVLSAGIVLLSAAFLLLNFRLAVSNTRAEKLIATTDLGENVPLSMRRHDKISMVMVGEGPLVRALQKALTENMNEAGIAEIEVVQELEPVYQNPVLVVKVGKPGPIWTPFFAMSQFSVHAGYSSNGDYTFMEAVEETHTTVGKPEAATMYAELESSDWSLGLISRPGYHQYLADHFAQEIVTALKDLYDV